MMTVECIGPAFTYRWPAGKIRLAPGHLYVTRVARQDSLRKPLVGSGLWNRRTGSTAISPGTSLLGIPLCSGER